MKRRRKGLLLAADDLAVGQFVTIHHGIEELSQLRGESLKITAINLPFIVVRALPNPNVSPLTLDVRDCTFMPVTEEFIAAQTAGKQV